MLKGQIKFFANVAGNVCKN